ncbi:hypothetical protein [Methanococcoides seepicolus]|uniref:Uncharacterized protein n=1 Tax=Methanococcoides seepicolus TaxID=2828780 RepID=A0A9E4ZFR8_9EURY|nr:hypothetical protein [Methanococcoides seepicolus]MCM1987075.1 hypothetical protein [Methanococcoides seepicolus]
MSGLKTKYKILLFFSSYTPLFMILLLKSISDALTKYSEIKPIEIDDFLISNLVLSVSIILVVLVIFIPNLILHLILVDTKSTINKKQLKVKSVQKMNHLYMEHLVTYIIPFLAFDFSDIFDMLSLLILLTTVCLIYIKSDMLYINIMFYIRNYNLYKVSSYNHLDIPVMLLSKKKHIPKNQIIYTEDIGSASEFFRLDIEEFE